MPESRKKVLVCPLDWGWGHASRMIPVIHLLLHNYDFEVVLGLSGSSGKILQAEFPELKSVCMPSSYIRYSSGESQVGKVFCQLHKVLRTTLLENIYLRKHTRKENISCVISDHRYGLFNKNIVSILVIHQLKLRFPSGLKVAENLFNWIQYRFFRKFDQIWVPDLAGKESIAGSLSTTPPKLNHIYKIGILSRFLIGKAANAPKPQKYYDIMVVLSGPEPQRSLLEDILTEQLLFLDQKVLFVRGISKQKTSEKWRNIQFVSRLSYLEMKAAFAGSGLIICRSGYSSIMDLMALGKKAILIPTPGQTEQEYLAGYLKEKGYFYSEKQKVFDISRALQACRKFQPPGTSDFSPLLYERLSWLADRSKKDKSKHENG